MTQPTALDGAEFRRIADALVPGRIDLNRTIADAKDALRHAATLADELERVRAVSAEFRRKHARDAALVKGYCGVVGVAVTASFAAVYKEAADAIDEALKDRT